MEIYVKAYEKENKEINFISFAIVILAIISCLVALVILVKYDMNLLLIVIPILVFELSFINYRKKAIISNINQIDKILYESLDIELVLSIYEKLLMRKYRADFSVLLFSYLDMLLVAGKIEQFIEVYNNNQKRFRALHMDIPLKKLRGTILSLESDRSEYSRVLQEEHKIYAKLKNKAKELEWQVKVNEAQFQYEIKEYEKALEILETLDPIGRYHILVMESYKQRCLYHLKKEYKRPKETLYPFLAVQRWKYLIETGEELVVPQSGEMIQLIDQCIANSKKTNLVYAIIAIVCFAVSIFMLVYSK